MTNRTSKEHFQTFDKWRHLRFDVNDPLFYDFNHEMGRGKQDLKKCHELLFLFRFDVNDPLFYDKPKRCKTKIKIKAKKVQRLTL